MPHEQGIHCLNGTAGPRLWPFRVYDLAIPLSWGNAPFRPVTLRPQLSPGLPFSESFTTTSLYRCHIRCQTFLGWFLFAG